MFEIPALIKIFCVFGLILVLNRLRLTLSLCMLLGAACLAFWMRMPVVSALESVILNLTKAQTLSLVAIVGVILIMSRLMKESGHLERIVNCFSRLFRDDRASGAFMAALIGLLPMPGGAVFSAPMVDAAFAGRRLSGEIKTAVNYWFRHIWEYWWPLYPGVVLAVALLEVPTWKFMAFMAPMTVITLLAGYVFILRPMKQALSDNGVGMHDQTAGIRPFLWEVMPILIVILIIMGQASVTGLLKLAGFHFVIPGVAAILPGLAGAFIWVCLVNRIPFHGIRDAVLDKGILPLIFLIMAIMVFKGVLEDSRAVAQIQAELTSYQIPALLIIMILPFLAGLITGIAIGFVGVSFPLIIPLFTTTHLSHYFAHAVLAYSFGYMGMMLSPVHLCFLVTKDYYRAGLLGSYRYIIMPAAMVMAVSVLIYLVMMI